MSIKSFQMKDLLEQVAINEAKKKNKEEEDDEEDEMEEEFVVEKKSSKEEEDDEEDEEDDEEEDGKNKSIDGEEDAEEEEEDESGKVKKMKKKAHMREDTNAMISLKPNSRPVNDPKSKIGMIAHMIGAMHAMKKEDLVKWFDMTHAQIGKEASHLPSGANEKSNEASIRMKGSHAVGKAGASANDPMPKLRKLSVKEDVEEMFAGSDLSEEFKDNASTLFEAAVNARAMLEIARLEEEYEAAFVESVTEITEELTSKLDSYLEYVTEQWMEANEVAIESTLRNELMEEFIGGLKGLFAEHYIDVPQEKIDVIEALAEKVETLEAALDETINENVELKRTVAEVEKEDILENLCDGLAFSQVEKFKALAEGIDFDGDLETYGRKLAFVKESYFTAKKSIVSTNIEEETFEGETSSNVTSIDPVVNRYVQAITKNIKK
jgi:hypothetical protein